MLDANGNEIVTENTEQAENTENAAPGTENEQKERVFTQAELDDIVTKRLERDREATSKRVAQEARDSYIAEQGHTWNGKSIVNEVEYKQALNDQKLINEYKEKEVPDELIAELVESKNFRKQFETERQVRESKEKTQRDFDEFMGAYPTATTEDIPQAVWDEVNKGKSLVDAYARHENQSLKQRLSAIELEKQADEQNATNENASTGSTKGKGGNKPIFFTAEQVKAMSNSEVDKNWNAIMESQKKW